MQELLRMIRQEGHIAEHTHAGPRDLYEANRSGKGKGHVFGNPESPYPWHPSSSADPWVTDQTSSSSASDPLTAWYGTDQDEDWTDSYVVDDDGWAVCSVGDSYVYEDELNYEDTDT
eukprot:3186660-Karenia_brevis.AAC.1